MGGGGVTVTSNERAADIEILGRLVSAGGEHEAITYQKDGGDTGIVVEGHDGTVTVFGVNDESRDDIGTISRENLNNPDFTNIPTADEVYSVKVNNNKGADGSVTVETEGDVSIRYGNMGIGAITSYGDFIVKGEDIYLDSYLTLYNDMELESTNDGEILIDFTRAYRDGTEYETAMSLAHIHNVFLSHFDESKEIANVITVNNADKFSLMIDMWDGEKFNLKKYDVTGSTFAASLSNLNVQIDDADAVIRDHAYIWISDAEQLAGIQKYAAGNPDSNILSYNFALKNNIDASTLSEFTPIGGETGYSGTFDGRGFRILGLNVGTQDEMEDNAGLFSKLIKDDLTGTVRDLRVYASNFYGKTSAGAVAGINDGGLISGVTTLGNHVEAAGGVEEIVKGSDIYGAAGGVAGVNKNKGVITGSSASDTVVVNTQVEENEHIVAGGVTGVNDEAGVIGKALDENGELVIVEGEDADGYLVTANSAVTPTVEMNKGLGGAVGVNLGTVTLVNSTGVTNGKLGDKSIVSDIGGVVGYNAGKMASLYNESIVMGKDNAGGVVGRNTGTIKNAVNAAGVDGADKTGGIAGVNSGQIESGRNAGTINGGDYVGGMVGSNGEHSEISNLVNSVFASIIGENYVGGIAGDNAGTISGSDNLINYGKIYGQQFVGGIAGINELTGKIENTNTDMTLYAKDSDAKYFGGVAGQNKGTITDASNTGNITAEGASYVGGIVGMNGTEDSVQEGIGNLTGEIINAGNVVGKSNVGGIAGINQNSILLQRKDENDKLTLSNAGVVKATDGSAGGIFYENKDAMNWVELVNSGTVDGGSQSDTGGIFGVNSGSAENSVFTNSGTVNGAGDVGGLFGSNSGGFKNSSLFATVDAKVTGTGNNVGGLIGYNTGTIEGGRTNADGTDTGYYKYKVYNNGVVTGANNVGGLIGYNAVEGNKSGYLYAGYNTGVVTATGNNAGGIVGNNEGTVSTVFNTIMTLDTNKNIVPGSVTGATNVGGLIGMNSGTLSNAYNTTGVEATADGFAGNAVGENATGGTVSNVYATNTDGKLIGENTAGAEKATNVYTFAANDDSAAKIEDAQQKLSESYDGFDFNSNNAAWKVYEGFNEDSLSEQTGYSTPLLKVFLTQAQYNGDMDFTYNAQEQSIVIGTDTIDAADTLAAYDNAASLLTALKNKNAGNGYLALYSGQIAGNVAQTTDDDGNETITFNPNNLGYDIDATYSIGKATIDVKLEDLWRGYGDEQMYGDEGLQNALSGYSGLYSIIAADGTDTVLNDAMQTELDGGITLTNITDYAVYDLPATQRATNDAGDHTWTAEAGLGDALKRNYQFNADGADNIVLTGTGKSHIKKADLNIVLSDVSREYGTAELSEGYEYGIESSSGLTNGDEKLLSYNTSYNVVGANNDGAVYVYDTATNEVRTHNAGDYTWTVVEGDYTNTFSGINTGNYNITVTAGWSKVMPKTLSVSNILATIVYGDQDGNDFAVSDGYGELQGVVYNDDISLNVDLKQIKDEYLTGAYVQNKGKRDTADVGTYADSLTFPELYLVGDGSKLGNYTLNNRVSGTITVKPAPLTITLKDVEHTYGTVLDADAIGYGIKSTEGLVNGDDGAQLTFNAETAKDKDKAIYYHEDGGEWRTNDANGDYSYLGDIEDAFKAGVSRANYYANNGGAVNLDNYDVEYKGGKSVVKPKELGISDILATIIYGNQGGAGFKVSEGGNLTGIVYDDDVSLSQELKIEDAKFATDGSYEINRNGRTTADAGDNYAQKLTFSNLPLYGRHAGNYTVNGNVDAAIAVTRAQLSVTAHDKLTQLGREPEYTGTTYDELNGSLVNGDDLSGVMHAFGIEEAEMLNNAGHYPGKIGVVVDGLYYYDGTHDWSGHHGLFANYDVNVAAGSLRVFVPVPDSSFNYGWLYDDAPYSRKWNFRERKAEIYFQDGGMEYDKNM